MAAKLKSSPCAEHACMYNTVACSRKAMVRSATSGLQGMSTRAGAGAWRTSRQFNAGLQPQTPAHKPTIKARAKGLGFNMCWIIPANASAPTGANGRTDRDAFWFTIQP